MECPPPLECPPSPPLAIAVNGFPNRARLAKAVVANTVHFVRNIIRSSTLREVPFGGSIGTAVGSSAPSIHSVETFGLLQEKFFRTKEFARGEGLRVFGRLKRRRNRYRARCVLRFKSFTVAASSSFTSTIPSWVTEPRTTIRAFFAKHLSSHSHGNSGHSSPRIGAQSSSRF
jgi:hypothetical protein